jgi:hypothetical protein
MDSTMAGAYAIRVKDDEVFISDAEPRKPELSRRRGLVTALVLLLLSVACTFAVLRSQHP